MSRGSYYKHGMSRTPVYDVWISMRDRCYNKNNPGYAMYGGRGIVVCDEWKTSFPNFLADMGDQPAGLELDRIDNDGIYTKSNCQWSTPKEQCRNRRSCIYYEHNGETKILAEWADELGIKRPTVYQRYRRGYRGEALFHSDLRGTLLPLLKGKHR